MSELPDTSLLQSTCKAAVKRGYAAEVFSTPQEAAARVLELAQAWQVRSIGVGGSVSVRSMGLPEKLAALGCSIIDHQKAGLSPDECLDTRRAQLLSDLMLCSCNAITSDGVLVNIDGVGNRVCALTFGPKHTIVIIGSNKIVDGSVDDALARIRKEACPKNARRLGLKTPCALTDSCNDCSGPQRMCSALQILLRKPALSDIRLLFVNTPLGY